MIKALASRLALTAALMLGFAGAAHAAELPRTLQQLASITTDLGGGTTALTYWVNHAGDVHVVTTVDTVLNEVAADPGRHVVTRFSAVMAPGQSQVISVPGPAGLEPQELRIRCLGDRIEVAQSGPAAQAEGRVLTN